MKILQINAVYGVGSTGVIVKDIHELCLSEGIESFVAYSTSNLSNDEIPNGYKIGGFIGKKFHALFSRINGKQGYFSRFSTLKLLRHIDSVKPNIVLLHNLHSNYINLNMLLAFLAKKDIHTVVMLHDCWYFTGGCFHYTAVGCDKWQKGCGNCPKKLSDTQAYFLDKSAKILNDRKKYFDKIECLTVIGVSKWIAEEARNGVFKGRDVRFVHNGVDLDIFKPTESDLREKYNLKDKFVILGPASKWLSPVNLDCFEKVSNKLEDDEVLLLLGHDSEQNLPDNIIPIPYISDRYELAKIYSAADVFVNLTREDTLCFMNLEPQACGTPVITFANTGTFETVDNICGHLVENDNAEGLLKTISLVKKQGKAKYTDKCIAWIKNDFEKNANYRRLIEILKNINKLVH